MPKRYNCFVSALFIPYFATSRIRVAAMLALAGDVRGLSVADLGSGDGRIVTEFARAGARATGYEIDEELYRQSQESLVKERLENVRILQKDFWGEDLSIYNIVTVYPMPDVMEELEKKLFSQMLPGAKILLNYYPFLDRTYTKVKENVYLYVV